MLAPEPIMILVLVLILATLWVRLRPRPKPDPMSWKLGVLEPWATMGLVLFFLYPVALVLARAVGWWPLAPLLLVAIVLVTGRLSGAYSGIRRIQLTGAGIEFRARWRNELLPWNDVVSVSYCETSGQSVVNTATDAALMLPPGPHGDAIGAAVATRIGQHWPVRSSDRAAG